MLAFAHTPTTIHALAFRRNEQLTWSIPESSVIDSKLALFLTQLGLGSAPNLDTGSPNLPWRNSAADLAKLLIPAEVRKMFAGTSRVIVVPAGNLWYLPFEVLPLAGSEAREPLLARHAVCYLPSLSQLRNLGKPAPKIRQTVGLAGDFFSSDRVTNQALAAEVVKTMPGQSLLVEIQQKPLLAAPSWLRMRADQLWVAQELPMAKTPWELRVLPVEPSRENALANWMQTPLRAPKRMLMPGLESSAQRGELNGGNEIFLPASTMMAAGTQAIWLSRWKTGGRSAHYALSRLSEELEIEAPSSAWRRTGLALWAEQLKTADEPLVPAAKGLPSSVSGQHPLFWSGYLMIGDHAPPD